MAMQYADPVTDKEQANMATAVQFIEAFNNDDWDTVRQVVAPEFVYHHPMGGTVQAGPEGMVAAWSGFKQLSPDSWHPIPIMVAQDEFVAVLLPTYGTFTGQGPQSPSPTGGRLDYGMVNMVRFEEGKLIEIWFGMDPLVELQAMGIAPQGPPRPISAEERGRLEAFRQATPTVEDDYDSVVPFDNVIVAMGPDQSDRATKSRRVEVYRLDSGTPELIYTHLMPTVPPYAGDPAIAAEISCAVVERLFDMVLSSGDTSELSSLVTEEVVVHPTAMPCESGFFGLDGVTRWLSATWAAFEDIAFQVEQIVAHGEIVAVRWSARGTSTGHFMGMPATGKPIGFTGVSMYRLEHGKIAEIWDARNTFGIIQQINPKVAEAHTH